MRQSQRFFIDPRRLMNTGSDPVAPVPGDNAEAATLSYSPPSPSETATFPPNGQSHPAEVLCHAHIPGYEILGELGRGGMGVVYRARQTNLNRIVAVKMVLSAGHASAADRERFLAEAEAVARMQHPQIVQIFETGQIDGLPYFTLEFVEGGSLADKLDGTPLSPREAAKLVELLARGMHYAHQQGIVHRDLKPANVLLTKDGTPKITDFGLAKKVEDGSGLTQAGAILGTPSYMAPEQAEGKKTVGPATDVYALGAILYECLTGRPPFKAATAIDTMMQVVSDDPVPPTRLAPRIPKDVETICLKCLQKEPAKRYESAAALADELGRFQRGEPIMARPVSRAGRVVKWVRRNPVLAGMIAAVALAMLAGTGVSTYFGLEASRQAGNARDREADAVGKGRELASANETLTRTADDLKRSRDDLETTTARSLLRPLMRLPVSENEISLAPLGRPGLDDDAKPVTDPEWEAVWELASDNGGRLGYRFVEEASGKPGTSRQLRDWAALVLPAAVGLDERRRAEVEALLLARLEDSTLGDEQKTDLTLALTAWDGLSRPGATRTARRLTNAMKDAKELSSLYPLVKGLLTVAPRLEPKDAEVGTATAVAAIIQAVKDVKDPDDITSWADDLSALAARLDRKNAAAIAAPAAVAIAQAIKDAKGRRGLSNNLEANANKLSALAAHLDPKDAAALAAPAAATLVQAMKDVKGHDELSDLAEGLSVLATHLDPKDAAAVSAPAAAVLVHAMKEAKYPGDFSDLERGLLAVAAYLNVKDAAPLAVALAQAMKDAKEPEALKSLADGLSGMAARMDPKDAAAVAATGAAILIQVMKDAKDPKNLSFLAHSLSALAARMDPKDAAAVTARALLQTLKDAKDPEALQILEDVQSALAAHMDPKEAGPLAATFVQAMKDAKDPVVFADGLSELMERLDPKARAAVAASAAAALVQAIKDVKDPNNLPSLASSLSALAARLDRKDAASAAAALVQAMKDAKDANNLSSLADCLSSLTERLDPKEAAVLNWQAVIALVPKPVDAGDRTDEFSVLLTGRTHYADMSSRLATAAAEVTLPLGAGPTFTALYILAAEPPPCRLSTQQLVELLKMSPCIGKVRRVVLDQLNNRYHHPFGDAWEFVYFAKEQHLDLDFTSPPSRPEAEAATPKP
jgi:predicted Ser/Thr protein kinase